MFTATASWEARLRFPAGSGLTLPLEKTGSGQRFPFPARRIEWAVLESLVKAEDPSPFPALTQLELWGRDLTGR